MTGPGTNTYLVGGGADERMGGDRSRARLDDAHVEAILAAAPGPIRWIFATHTHTDHSPATAAAEGAHRRHRSYGRRRAHREWQDATFVPDVTAARRRADRARPGDARCARSTRPAMRRTTSATCSRKRRLLFTGDHVMQASTVVINPPDGDMAAYIESLRSLLANSTSTGSRRATAS